MYGVCVCACVCMHGMCVCHMHQTVAMEPGHIKTFRESLRDSPGTTCSIIRRQGEWTCSARFSTLLKVTGGPGDTQCFDSGRYACGKGQGLKGINYKY